MWQPYVSIGSISVSNNLNCKSIGMIYFSIFYKQYKALWAWSTNLALAFTKEPDYQVLLDNNISLKRYTQCECRPNNFGRKLLEMCKSALAIFIVNLLESIYFSIFYTNNIKLCELDPSI
jgi:predicted RNase H-like nuclease